MLGAGERERIFEDQIRCTKSFVDFAALVAKMKTDIALIVDDVSAAPPIVRIFAAFQVLVHQRSAVPQRLFDRVNRGQFFVLDFDQLERFFRDCLIDRGHRGDHVADIANFVGRENLLVSHVGAKRIGRNVQVVAANNGDHPWQRRSLAGIDAPNARVGQRAAQHFRVKPFPASEDRRRTGAWPETFSTPSMRRTLVPMTVIDASFSNVEQKPVKISVALRREGAKENRNPLSSPFFKGATKDLTTRWR